MSTEAKKKIKIVDGLNIYSALDSISKAETIKYDVFTSIKINKIKEAFASIEKGIKDHPQYKEPAQFEEFKKEQGELVRKHGKVNASGTIELTPSGQPVFKSIDEAMPEFKALDEKYKDMLEENTERIKALDEELSKEIDMPTFEPLDPALLKGDMNANDKILIQTLMPILKI
jgi:predicted DNA-binding WGR domain protein